MATSIIRTSRISHDMKILMDAPPPGISAWLPCEQNVTLVEAQIMGPDDTPYAGGLFQLRVTFPDRYPLEPLNVKFKTKVYHPNISHDGNICLSVLNMPPKGDWTPALSLTKVLLGIQSLLAAPNPDDPLDADAAKEMRTHPHLFRSRAAEWTRTYANPDGRIVTEGPAPGGPSGNSAWSAGPSGAAATMDLAGTTHQLLSEEREHGHSSATTMQGGAIKDESLGYNASVEQSSIEQPLVQACTMCDASADRHIKEVSERMRRSRGAPSDGSALRAEQTNVQTCQATTSGTQKTLSEHNGAIAAPKPSRLALGKRTRE